MLISINVRGVYQREHMSTGTLEWGKVGRVAVGICGVPINVYQRLVYNI